MLMKILKGNRGFTMAESIVMVSVLGGLTLLGSNKMLKTIDEAKVTQYRYDSKIVEEVATIYTIQNDDLPIIDNNPISSEKIDAYIQSQKAFTKEGRLSKLDLENNQSLNYYIIREDFIEDESRSKLDGTFLTNDDLEIIYINDKIN